MSKIISIHQPLFMPWFPYMEKMYYSDIFVFMTTCQYEKGSCMNRNMVFDKMITKPISKAGDNILDKVYSDGQNLIEVNISWIDAFRKTLNIQTPIKFDFPTEKTKTARIVEICKAYGGDKYLAAAEAPDKYLDVKMLEASGIEFLPFKSKNKKNTIEMIHEIGIDKCIKTLERGKKKLHSDIKKREDAKQKVLDEVN